MSSKTYPRDEWQVPAYHCEEFVERKSSYCICVFAINEGNKLIKQLGCMSELADRIDIVLADGGSSDGTTDCETLQGLGVNTLLVKEGPGKLGAQIRMACAWAIDRGYQGVVVIDGNNKDDVSAIDRFIEAFDAGFDHIQGSRFVPGGKHENTPLTRLFGVRILHAPLLSIASGFGYTDTTNGFRGYSRRLLTDNRLKLFRDILSHYETHYYIAYRAPRLGFRCTEVPVTRRYPASGKVPTKISPIRGNLQVLFRLILTCLGRYNP